MPHDPARVAETREWFQKASLDLRGARIDLAADPPLLEDALFHCQQAVEKTLKACLAWHDKPFRKTHSLEELRGAGDAGRTDGVTSFALLIGRDRSFTCPGRIRS